MAKWQNDSMLDAAVNYIKNNATEEYLCTSQPADRAAAISAAVASKTGMTTGDFTGPSDGDASGRKIQVNAQNGLTASATGDATHVALCSGTTLLYVTTNTSQSVTSGNTVNIGAWDIEVADVTP
jgi:hypothetical protein